MEQLISRFRGVLQFLASSPHAPEDVPGLSIPQNSQRLPHEFREGENSLVTVALAYGDLVQPFVASEGNTLPKEESILDEIDAVLSMMLSSGDPNLWIWVGFQKTGAWKTVRRLSQIALKKFGWPMAPLTEEELGLVLDQVAR